jgi:hypothetical protein
MAPFAYRKAGADLHGCPQRFAEAMRPSKMPSRPSVESHSHRLDSCDLPVSVDLFLAAIFWKVQRISSAEGEVELCMDEYK